MKIAIIGYGAMGKRIAELAPGRGFDISAIIDPYVESATAAEITSDSLGGAEVALEFTTPDAAVDNIAKLAACGVNIVVGTTGWHQKLGKVRDIIDTAGVGLVHCANFSIGVNLFYEIVRRAAELLAKFPEYDVFCHELHHRRKKDSPSGTAQELANILISKLAHKEKPVFDRLDRQIAPAEIHISSTRAGHIPGEHIVGFDSEYDTIKLIHTARSRDGLVEGALKAAQWIKGKKGVFKFSDAVLQL